MIKLGNKVKRKSISSNKIGTVIKIFEKDNPVYDKHGNLEFVSLKGEFLVEFETYDYKKHRVCYSRYEIIEVK